MTEINNTPSPELDQRRYIVGYFCHKGSGHFEMYHDPDAEMACGSSLVPLYIDAEDAEWLSKHDLLPPGRWDMNTPSEGTEADRG